MACAFSIESPTSPGRKWVRMALVESNLIVPSLKIDTSVRALNNPFSTGSGVFVRFSSPFAPFTESGIFVSPKRFPASSKIRLRSSGLFLYATVSILQFLHTPGPCRPQRGHEKLSTVKPPHAGHLTRGSHVSQLGQDLSTTSRLTASFLEASTISRRIPPNWPVGKRQ